LGINWLNELSIVSVSTLSVPIIIDEGFESENDEFDHHNIISENASVVSMSVDIPDVIDVEVDIPMNDTCDELSKCFNVTEVSEPESNRGRTATRNIRRKKVEKCKTPPQNSGFVSNVQIRHCDVWRIPRKFFFPCKHCDFLFSREYSLREHLLNKHGDICLDDYHWKDNPTPTPEIPPPWITRSTPIQQSILQLYPWEEMCKALNLLPKSKSC